MEDEWEEEEQLVVVELSGVIDADFLSKCQGTCKILDIDSDQPIMQVGPYVFSGEYEDALGTCVLFQEGQTTTEGPDSSPELTYKCHTGKKLMMQRTFLAEKKSGEDGSASAGGASNQGDGMTADGMTAEGMTDDGMTAGSVSHPTQPPEEKDRLKNRGEQSTEEEGGRS